VKFLEPAKTPVQLTGNVRPWTARTAVNMITLVTKVHHRHINLYLKFQGTHVLEIRPSSGGRIMLWSLQNQPPLHPEENNVPLLAIKLYMHYYYIIINYTCIIYIIHEIIHAFRS